MVNFLLGGVSGIIFVACLVGWIEYVLEKKKATTKVEYVLQFIIPFYWGIKYLIEEYKEL